MKAFVIEAPGKIKMIETPKPLPGPYDVVSRVMYSGICGTDMGMLSGNISFVKDGRAKYPIRIGHEWSGIVDSVGLEVTKFKTGDRVVSDNWVSCGKCSYCNNGDIYNCPNGRSLGTIKTWDYGSFAEYILIPQRHMFLLDDSISLEQGALIEPATIGMAGVEAINTGKDDAVLVTGTGAVGLSAAALAKAAGAGKVFIAGRKHQKLETGLKNGADIAINMADDDLAKRIEDETEWKGVNKIIETTGSADVLDKAIDCAGNGCKIALVGFYEDKINTEFNLDRIVLNKLTITGVAGNPFVPQVMELMKNRAIDLTSLISRIYRLEDCIEAFTAANENSDARIKVLVRMTA